MKVQFSDGNLSLFFGICLYTGALLFNSTTLADNEYYCEVMNASIVDVAQTHMMTFVMIS